MLATKIACPKCGVVLKSAKPLPAGKEVLCPKCHAGFTVPSDGMVTTEGIQTTLPPPPVAVAIQANGPTTETHDNANFFQAQTLPDVPAPFPAARVVAAIAEPKDHRARTLFLVFGGFLLFIGVGVGLAIWCFSKMTSPSDGREKKEAKETKKTKKTTKKEKAPVEETPLVVLPAADQAKVNRALTRGIEYLRKSQDQISGAWPGGRIGCTALPALTLLECGVPKDDHAVQRAAGYIRANHAALNTTYDLALALLFLDRLDDRADSKLIQVLAYRLLAGQTATGGWGYNCPVLSEPDQAKLALVLNESSRSSPLDIKLGGFAKLQPVDAKLMPPGLQNLPVLQAKVTAKDQVLQGDGGDNSNTQFAILAMWAAKRHNIPLERTLALIAHRFRTSQTPNGGWGYTYRGGAYPSMTCAGLLGMAVGLGLVKEVQEKKGTRAGTDPAKDPFVNKGIQMLSASVGTPTKRWENVPMAVDMYTLWSMERVAVIYRLRTIGGKDWYPWGAEMLVSNQAKDGSWNYHNPPVGTSLGLLFLKRANLAKDLTEKLQLSD